MGKASVQLWRVRTSDHRPVFATGRGAKQLLVPYFGPVADAMSAHAMSGKLLGVECIQIAAQKPCRFLPSSPKKALIRSDEFAFVMADDILYRGKLPET